MEALPGAHLYASFGRTPNGVAETGHMEWTVPSILRSVTYQTYAEHLDGPGTVLGVGSTGMRKP